MAKLPSETALSVRQPWAWLLVHGHKDVENRNWQTKFRGKCLIHAGQVFDHGGYEWVREHFKIKMPEPSEFKRGGIIGWVEVVDCVSESNSPWFFGKYGFVVEGKGELPFVPMPGKLGFFKVEKPIIISVEVQPSVLIADSGAMADVMATVEDLDGNPLEGIALDGGTSPASLGSVTGLPDTDVDGVSQGKWHAGRREGKGFLIVSAYDGQGRAGIELIGRNGNGKGDEGEEDDDDDGEEEVKNDEEKKVGQHRRGEKEGDGEEKEKEEVEIKHKEEEKVDKEGTEVRKGKENKDKVAGKGKKKEVTAVEVKASGGMKETKAPEGVRRKNQGKKSLGSGG